VKFIVTKKVRQHIFSPSSVLLLNPGFGSRAKIRNPGTIRIRDQDKHPGTTKLHGRMKTKNRKSENLALSGWFI
jgi:hypothetical protein